MPNIFKRLISCLACQLDDLPAAPELASTTEPPRSDKKRPARKKGSRSSVLPNVHIPLEYVARDANPGDAREGEILGRRSSYSVGARHDGGETPNIDASQANSEAFIGVTQESHPQPTAPLLPPQSSAVKGRKCLVLDLDETLVHSSFKYFPDADFVIPVDIEGRTHKVYVAKRPGVDEFLDEVGKLFEVVVFTASVAKYGDPLLDRLGHKDVIHHRLFRESCYNFNGNYIKNLSQLGRPLHEVIIIDNSPASYALHPQHAVPISTWFSDMNDSELLGMLPFLSDLAGPAVNDVSAILEVITE